MIDSRLKFAVIGQVRVGEKLQSIVVFPAGTEDIGSSRLRAYPILDSLINRRDADLKSLLAAADLDSPILWFQKKISEEHLILAREFKKRDAKVVYDCDESGYALSGWAHPHFVFELFHLADCIVGDTPERIRWIRHSGTLAKTVVLENQVDYGYPSPNLKEAQPGKSTDQVRILWYGNSCNLFSLANISGFLQKLKHYQLVLCGATKEDAARYLPGCDPEIHPWNRETFLNILNSCDLSLLSHWGSQSDSRKSGHKMITSICHGIPAIVSATPDYRRIAKYAGVEDFVYHKPADLENILIKALDFETRSSYISLARPRLMQRYYPGSFADNVSILIEKLAKTSASRPRIYQSLQRGMLGSVSTNLVEFCGKAYWRRMQR